MKGGKPKQATGKILNDLREYTVYHFQYEEDLFDQYGYPETVEDLEQHKCLHYLGTPHADLWVFNKDNKRIDIRPKWSFASNNGRALCQAASLGMGIIRSPALSVRSYVQSGELVEILPDYKIHNLSVYATYLQRNYYHA